MLAVIAVSAQGVIVGALLAALVYVIVCFLGNLLTGAPVASIGRPAGAIGLIAVILAILVFISYALCSASRSATDIMA